MKKDKICLGLGILFLILFAVLTVVLLYVDIGEVTVENTAVIGLSSFNKLTLPPKNHALYIVSDALGACSFAMSCGAALLGLFYLLKNRSFLKVPLEIYATGVLYVIDILIYFVSYKFLVMNIRPVGDVESSYPSSHTLLSITVVISAIVILCMYIKSKKIKKLLITLLMCFELAAVVTRYFSGYHWTTDILGGIFLGCGLSLLYRFVIFKIQSRKSKEGNDK